MNKTPLLLLSMILFAAVPRTHAGDVATQTVQQDASEVSMPPFHAGGHEVELRGGALFSFLNDGNRKPILNYAMLAGRFGWMLNDVQHSGLFRGNTEFLIEAFGGDVFKGPGNFVVGGEAIIRYNFVQPGARIVPYLEFGGGGLYNDVYHQQVQHLIGEGFEFVLHGGGGIRWMINDRWALSFEGEYRHISNAGLAARNQGLNSVGGTLGLNLFF